MIPIGNQEPCECVPNGSSAGDTNRALTYRDVSEKLWLTDGRKER